MRPLDKQKDRLQIPLMYAFRDAFEKRDADKREDTRVDGERVVAERGSLRRRGADETILRRDLAIDLSALVDTINLGSSVDLSGLDYVRGSILNYGLDDLSRLTIGANAVSQVGANLKAALLQHEPRLNPDSIFVEESESSDEVNQRVRFKVRAEMLCKPLDVPIEFVAEVDLGSGKILLPRVPAAA